MTMLPYRALADWTGAKAVERLVLDGRYARLEPLDPDRHGQDLLTSALQPGSEGRFRYLFDRPPQNIEDMMAWARKAAAASDPLFFAVIRKDSGRAHGRQALMRIDPGHGSVEIGNILWGPGMARSRVATEAFYLFARHAFETLGYRRLEWKCDSLNLPSRQAATRFGFYFEGVFRQHMVVKNLNRDTAWFAIIDSDWPRLKAGYESWLHPGNFDMSGQQIRKLKFAPPA